MIDKSYELIEHTADISIRVNAKDLKGLFSNTATAMFDIIAEKKPQVTSHKSEVTNIIKQKAENLDELLINWLNELLSLSATKELIFSNFKIERLDENNLEAAVTGNNFKDYKVNTEIKAATYHELKIAKTKAGWQAEVIFDV